MEEKDYRYVKYRELFYMINLYSKNEYYIVPTSVHSTAKNNFNIKNKYSEYTLRLQNCLLPASECRTVFDSSEK